MRKIYLSLLCCCLTLTGYSTKYYSVNTSGGVTIPANWNTSISGSGTSASGFTNPNDTFVVILSMGILSGQTWDVAGTVILEVPGGFSRINKSGAVASTIKVGGALILKQTANITTSINSGDLDIWLYNDLFVLDSSYITSSGFGFTATPYTHIHFCDTATLAAPKTITWTAQLADTTRLNYANLIFEQTSVRLMKSNLRHARRSSAGDSLKGTLICDTFTINSGDRDSFTIADGAAIYTAHPGGLDSSIQHMLARHFSGGAHYIYNGSAAQVTGYTLPINMTSGGSVSIDNRAGVTLQQPDSFAAGSALKLIRGTYTNGSQLYMGNGSDVMVDSGFLSASPTYAPLVNVTYLDLGANALAFTTGNELIPTAPTTTIGKLIVNKPLATITLGSAVTVNDSVIIDTGTLDASATNYNIDAKGHWINWSGPAAFVAQMGSVSLTGSAAQHVGGSYPTTFYDLTLSNSNGAVIDTTETVLNTLALTSGKLDIGDEDLILGTAATAVAPGVFSNTNMIVANANGHVRKMYTADGSYLFPIGDNSEYTPIELNVTAAAYLGGASAGVNLKAVKHPANNNVNNYLNRYWSVEMILMTAPVYQVTATYVNGDMTGREDSMSMGEYPTVYPWIKYAAADTTANTLTTISGSSTATIADFTGISTTPPSIVAPADIRICMPGGAAPLAAITPLGDPTLTYSWAPAEGLSTTAGLTTIATPTITTTYVVTITDGNGFKGTDTVVVTVDGAPTLAGGAITNSPVCEGNQLMLEASLPAFVTTYSWAGPVALTSGGTDDTAYVDPAMVSAMGVYTVTITNGTDSGCIASFMTPSVTVNTLPAPTVVSTLGGTVFCDTTTIFADNGGDGIMFFQLNTPDGVITAFPSTSQLVNASGTYYFRAQNGAGCWGPDDSVIITINPLPTPYAVTGGGAFCPGDTGVHVGISMTDTGVEYQLMLDGLMTVGAPILGTGADIDFGLQNDTLGSYTVVATNIHTGCVNEMLGSAYVLRNTLPTPYPMLDNAGYCVGGIGLEIQLMGSDPDPMVSYQLYFRDTTTGSVANPVGFPLAGTGLPLNFSYYTGWGTYSVIATNTATGCIDTMLTADSIWINPLPNVYTLLPGGGAACTGFAAFELKLDSSEMAVPNYELLIDGTPTGIPFNGNDDTLSFGYQTAAGIYTARATDANGCVSMMNGSDTIVIYPLPTQYPVLGGGQYCVGDTIPYDILLAFSDVGVSYQLYNGLGPVGAPEFGSFSPITFPGHTLPETYGIFATDTTTGCTSDMTGSVNIIANQLPNIYTIYGSDSFCAGSTGINLWLTSSQPPADNINYNLYADWSYMATLPGDGTTPFDLGIQTLGGTYTVVAVNTITGCHDTMAGTATVVVNPLPIVYVVSGGGAYCVSDSTAYPVNLSGSEYFIDYQVIRDGSPVGAPFPGTGVAIPFGATDTAGTYTVIATNTINGCQNNMAGSATVTANGLPIVQSVVGGGSYCAGTGAPSISLAGSESGINYRLFRNTVYTGVTISGTGSSVSFGPQDSAGIYTVEAVNTMTACENHMSGTAIIVIKPLPNIYAVAGGGNYCAGDPGLHVYLSGSIPAIHYQLYKFGLPVGTPVHGTGFGLDFGLHTTPGTYTVIATDTFSMCTSAMAGSVSINIDPLPLVFGITGGDTICAGEPGVALGLTSSSSGIEYQLYNGTSPVGTPVTGTGSALSFGTFTTAGTYTVKAHNPSTTCVANMSGTSVIVVNPLPSPCTLSGGGAYCAGDTGRHIYLSCSDGGVNYQLYLGGVPIGGPLVGTSFGLDFGAFLLAGTYNAVGVNTTTGCQRTMTGTATISINPLPTQYDLTGGGVYCVGDTIGLHIGMAGSQSGISYQLYQGSLPSGSAVTGTGSSIDFGTRLPDSTYTVIATNPGTGCIDTMTDSAVIAIQNYSIPTVTLTATPGTVIGVGDMDTVRATVTGGGGSETYQWEINGNLIVGATNNTFIFTVYFDADTIVCHVTSSGLCGGITRSDTIIIHLEVNGINNINNVGDNVRLIPNPNKGTFYLKGTLGNTNGDDVFAEVTNMMGQVVYRTKVTTTNGAIDERIQLGGNLANGMYLLNLRSGASNKVFHFVIEQ